MEVQMEGLPVRISQNTTSILFIAANESEA